MTLGYSVAHVAGWGTDTGAHNCASTEDRTRNLSRASVCTCGAAQMENKDQRSCSLLTRLIVKPRYLSGHRASASKTRFDVPPAPLYPVTSVSLSRQNWYFVRDVTIRR